MPIPTVHRTSSQPTNESITHRNIESNRQAVDCKYCGSCNPYLDTRTPRESVSCVIRE